MLRAVALLSLLRRLQRFSTPGHPDALVACYLAACSLAGLDFHQRADDDFVEVGMALTGHPPHGSGRAHFAHPALVLGK